MSKSWKQKKTHMATCLRVKEESCKQQKMDSFPVPDELAIRIALSLQVSDLCALACCSKVCSKLCGSDYIWACLAQKRWPSLDVFNDSSSSSSRTSIKAPTDKRWRAFYMEIHNEKVATATLVARYVERNLSFGSLEVGKYQQAMVDLYAMKFGYEDVERLLFKSRLTVQLNLLALHYCMNWLGVSVKCLVKALRSRKIADRKVCVKWWTLGRWSNNGYRMHDDLHTRQFTLLDVAIAKEEEALAVLSRGAIHEVLRVQITVSEPLTTSWSSQSKF